MQFEQVFAKERARYVEFLAETIAAVGRKFPGAAGEVLISVNNDALPYPYRYVRVDVIATLPDGNPKLYQVKLDVDPAVAAGNFTLGECTVEVRPFTWESIQLVVNYPIVHEALVALEGWMTRWLDVEDLQPTNAAGTCQTVHSFTQVETDGTWWFFTGDFGSAPTAALLELLALLVSQGATHIVIRNGDDGA